MHRHATFPGLEPFAALNFGRLGTLVCLKAHLVCNSPPATLLFSKLHLLPKLVRLELWSWEVSSSKDARPMIGQLNFPRSLQQLYLNIPHSFALISTFLHVCRDLPSLESLFYSGEVPCNELAQLANLTRLKKLNMMRVSGMPQSNSVVSVLETLPRAALLNPDGCNLGWLNTWELFSTPFVHTLEFLRPFYDLGLRPPAERTAKEFVQANPLACQLMEAGWVNLKELAIPQPLIHQFLPYIVDKPSFDRFFGEIFRPLVAEVALSLSRSDIDDAINTGGSAESAAAGMLLTRQFGDRPGGEWAVVRAHLCFVQELIEHPEWFYFDAFRSIGETPLHFYAVNDQLEEFFVAQGLPVDSSVARLDVLLSVWKGVNEYMYESDKLIAGMAFDAAFVFRKMWTCRNFFNVNLSEILDCVQKLANPRAAAHIIATLLRPPPPDSPPDWDELIDLCFMDMAVPIYDLVGEFVVDCKDVLGAFVERAMANGAWGAVAAMLSERPDFLAQHTFYDNKTPLHVLLQRNKAAIYEKSEMVQFVEDNVPRTSPMLSQADSFGYYPIYYWIQLRLDRLVVHFGPSVRLVGPEGPTIIDRIDQLRALTPDPTLDKLKQDLVR